MSGNETKHTFEIHVVLVSYGENIVSFVALDGLDEISVGFPEGDFDSEGGRKWERGKGKRMKGQDEEKRATKLEGDG